MIFDFPPDFTSLASMTNVTVDKGKSAPKK